MPLSPASAAARAPPRFVCAAAQQPEAPAGPQGSRPARKRWTAQEAYQAARWGGLLVIVGSVAWFLVHLYPLFALFGMWGKVAWFLLSFFFAAGLFA